jgi:hypothetical protein
MGSGTRDLPACSIVRYCVGVVTETGGGVGKQKLPQEEVFALGYVYCIREG